MIVSLLKVDEGQSHGPLTGCGCLAQVGDQELVVLHLIAWAKPRLLMGPPPPLLRKSVQVVQQAQGEELGHWVEDRDTTELGGIGQRTFALPHWYQCRLLPSCTGMPLPGREDNQGARRWSTARGRNCTHYEGIEQRPAEVAGPVAHI